MNQLLSKEKCIVYGKKISLRPIDLTDISDRYLSWLNDKEVLQYLEIRFQVHTRESLEEFIKDCIASKTTQLFTIRTIDTDKHVGNIKLKDIDFNHKTSEIGILIGDRSYWGKGLGCDTVKTITKYAFEEMGLNKLTAGSYSNNIGSIRIFEKCGFVREGCCRQQYIYEGQYVDRILMGLTQEDYKKI